MTNARPYRTRLHLTWEKMRDRCNNPNAQQYRWYGAKGITVWPAWNRSDGYAQFQADILSSIGPHPGKGYDLDRVRANGHYEPGNVQWLAHGLNVQKRTRPISGAALTETDAAQIKLLRGVFPQWKTAAMFGISRQHAGHIQRGYRWA